MLFNWLEIENAYYLLKYLTTTPVATNVSLVVVIVLMLLFAMCPAWAEVVLQVDSKDRVNVETAPKSVSGSLLMYPYKVLLIYLA